MHEADMCSIQEDALVQTKKLTGALQVDEGLVMQVLVTINQEGRSPGLQAARTVGVQILDAFFAGSLECFLQSSRQHASYRRLLTHPELTLSASFLWYAVRLDEHLLLLQEGLAKKLPLSHHRLLMHIRDTTLRRQMAMHAVSENWSRRQLSNALRVGQISRRGRRPTPPLIKGLRQLNQAIELAQSESVSLDLLRHCDRDEVRILMLQTATSLQQLQSLMVSLRGELSVS